MDGFAGGVDGQIKVSFAGLSQGSTDISRSAQMIQQQLDDLKSRLQPLVSEWTGTASTEYQAHQAKWDQAAADLQQVLASIATAVGRAGEDYSDGERQNAARWT